MLNLSKEATVERNVLNYLNSLPGTKATKWPQEGRTKGHPDILCVHNGVTIMIEMKRPGKEQTMLQATTMSEWIHVGVIGAVAKTLDHVKDMMNTIIEEEAKIHSA